MKLKVILISVFIIVLGIIIGVVLYFNSDYKLNKDRKNNILTVSKNYYENYYYPSVDEDFFKKYKDKSIKIPLTLINNSNSLKDKINNKLFKACDFNNTYVEIIPESPYGIEDYKVKVNLDC